MKMVSEYGNVIRTVKSPNEVKRLKELGYTEVKEETKPFTPKRKPKEDKE